MPLLDELKVDASTLNLPEMEDALKAGPIPPEGFHHAVLDGFRDGVSSNTQRKFRELTFKILTGPGKGQTVKESLWNSDEPKGKNRVLIFAHRLGLLQRVNNTLAPIPGKYEFNDVIGAQCIIEVKHEEYDRTDGKGKGTKAILSFEGVISLDDKRVAGVPRAAGDQVAAAAAGAKAAAPSADKYAGM